MRAGCAAHHVSRVEPQEKRDEKADGQLGRGPLGYLKTFHHEVPPKATEDET
jgi:hypothetical protein